MKKILCTFANYPLSIGFERYRKEAEALGVFDSIYTYDENDLDVIFRRKFGRFLYPYSRGYGYWSWKPIVIKKTLDSMQEGDILLYTDLGCYFNPKGKKRLDEYFEIVDRSPSGILGIRAQEKDTSLRTELKLPEYEWTKGDIFDYFGVRNNRSFTDTNQFEATIVFIKKCPASVAFVNEWVNVIYNHFDLITDKPSKSPNLDGFKDNRHDQSIFSMLAKKYQISEFSRNELCPTEFDNLDWNIMSDYPIWARRDVYYKSMWHYTHRFSLRKYYNAIWSIRYFFKSILRPNTYHR